MGQVKRQSKLTWSRRRFLRVAAGAAAGGAAAIATPRAISRAIAGANDKLRLALIGCGVRGSAFFGAVEWVCDPDANRLAAAAKAAGVKADHAVTDFRRLLDDGAVDAVIIATPDHWHAPAAILACAAGKHVYVEKPCSHNFRESQMLLQAAAKHKVVVQHGTQQRSRPFIAEAVQRLREGEIGDVLVAKAWNVQRRESIGHARPTQPPPEVDYDLWVGPAELTPFQANCFHSSWHWWYNFGSGDVGNDGAHELDYARWGLGVDTLPTKVDASGGKLYFDDDQQFPDTVNCTFEFAGVGAEQRRKQLQFEMRLWSKNYPYNCDSGVEFYGDKGTMFLSKRGRLRILDDDNQIVRDEKADDDMGLAHLDNFTAAIRGAAPANAPLIEAHRSVALIHLANASLRAGKSLRFDPTGESILDDPQAAELLTRKYRSGGHWAEPQEQA